MATGRQRRAAPICSKIDFMMNRTWFLRDEIYRVFHRWPIMLLAFGVGCALGWLISWIWPAPYKATAQVYVGLNAYRALDDVRFLAQARPKYSNVDNYHYWQMSQLDSAIFLNQYIDETLKNLRKQDERWKRIQPEELRSILKTEWRTSGNWDLIAKYSNEEMAAQAAQTWSEVVVEQSRNAVSAARATIFTDQELQSVRDAALQASLRQQALDGTDAQLASWQQTVRPSGSTLPQMPVDQPLETAGRWQILALVTSLAQFNPAWQSVLAAQPAPEAPLSAYQVWIERVRALIAQESAQIDQQQTSLKDQQILLEKRYAAQSDSSLGFAPTLEFDGPRQLVTTPLRPTAVLVLTGGIVGLLGWVIVQLALISRMNRSQDTLPPGITSAESTGEGL